VLGDSGVWTGENAEILEGELDYDFMRFVASNIPRRHRSSYEANIAARFICPKNILLKLMIRPVQKSRSGISILKRGCLFLQRLSFSKMGSAAARVAGTALTSRKLRRETERKLDRGVFGVNGAVFAADD
jgi:hypothetical protein